MVNLNEIQVLKASNEHFYAIANLHALGITEGFLTSLGTRFLAVLYRGIAQTSGSGILVAVKHESVLGFISYSKDLKVCYKQVLKSEWLALIIAMVPNVFNPQIYRKALETLRYPFKRGENSINSFTSGAELLSMAVDQNVRGKGIGKLLVSALDLEMSLMSVDSYYVVTNGADERSNAFYLTCGFTKIAEFLNHGRPMKRYFKSLKKL